jgi:hypothetical protein
LLILSRKNLGAKRMFEEGEIGLYIISAITTAIIASTVYCG